MTEQPELALARAPQRSTVPMEVVRAQKSAAAAFSLACNVSGLEDKEVYLALDIDAGYFSNIKKGKATLQADLIAMFCEAVGNTIYPEWLAFQLGCTLVMVQSEAERRAEAAEKRAREWQMKYETVADIVRGRAAA